jgi:C4-type Zn-finger protein
VVKRCYEKLHKRINVSTSETHMSRIIKTIWKDKKKAPKMQVAYTISVCDLLLNPNIPHIQVNEEILKPKINENLVSFNLFIYLYYSYL